MYFITSMKQKLGSTVFRFPTETWERCEGTAATKPGCLGSMLKFDMECTLLTWSAVKLVEVLCITFHSCQIGKYGAGLWYTKVLHTHTKKRQHDIFCEERLPEALSF